MSLEDLEKDIELQRIDNLLRLAAIAANSYDGFKALIRKRLDKAVKKFESQTNKMKYEFGEDALTLYLMALLEDETLGLIAYHEVNERGHCDITITFGEFIWHGEAKRHMGGYAYLFKGYGQLTERYSTGTEIAKSGGLIIYTENSNCLQMMNAWESHVKKCAPRIHVNKGFSITHCPKNQLVLISNHTHTVSGLDYEVIHYPINFYHKPVDPDL